jgi:hypothetical protein
VPNVSSGTAPIPTVVQEDSFQEASDQTEVVENAAPTHRRSPRKPKKTKRVNVCRQKTTTASEDTGLNKPPCDCNGECFLNRPIQKAVAVPKDPEETLLCKTCSGRFYLLRILWSREWDGMFFDAVAVLVDSMPRTKPVRIIRIIDGKELNTASLNLTDAKKSFYCISPHPRKGLCLVKMEHVTRRDKGRVIPCIEKQLAVKVREGDFLRSLDKRKGKFECVKFPLAEDVPLHDSDEEWSEDEQN